ncbi:ion channel [Halobacteria archaeon AArc-dxtr1]|nr:ion channel [Halobacteria archaeon AArc-dxtr1]
MLIVVTVAVVSIVTGLAAMVAEPFLDGESVIELQTATGFSTVSVGFALLAAAWGMVRGFRLAYVLALFLLVLAAMNGIAQTRLTAIPLVVFSVIATILLVRWGRGQFVRSTALTATQTGALLAIGGFLLYGTVGSYVLRTDIHGVDGLIDGLYFTLVTASTVGYGDVHATTEAGRLFAITLILLGPASILAVAGSLFGPALESRLTRAGARATRADRSRDKHSLLLLGSADLGERIADELAEQASLTVVTPDDDWARKLEADGIDVRVENPADDAVIERETAGEQATIVVATGAETTPYAVLATRRVDPDARLVALTPSGHEADLAEIGADATIDPEGLLARTTAAAAFGE